MAGPSGDRSPNSSRKTAGEPPRNGRKHTTLGVSASSARRRHRETRRYDAGVQPPPSGLPPQWGSSPYDPRAHVGPDYGGQPAPGGYRQPGSGGYAQQPPTYPGYATPPAPPPGYPHAGYPQQPGQGPPAWGGYGAAGA